jgi:deoxyribodipyrimidine photo-lyase
MTQTCLVWFRQDLRLADNLALRAALETDLPIFCIFIADETTPAEMQLGGASKWWLHQSLTTLDHDLQQRGNKLLLYRGNPHVILQELITKLNITKIFWNRCYDAHAIARDKKIKATLLKDNIEVQSFNSHLLFEPWTILNQAGQPYKVFTPFWKKGCLSNSQNWPQSFPIPKKIRGISHFPLSDSLISWKLLPTHPNWASQFYNEWQPGEAGAHKRLKHFMDIGILDYKELRDFPAQEKVSRLSPHLHWGEIAPWRIWNELENELHSNRQLVTANVENFQSELGWREFSYYLLYHFPQLPTDNFRSEFNQFPWKKNSHALKAWQQGKTGYPLVDAGMRQLWQTGWMHNRVRMVVASFLVKDLRLHWHEGARWFWDTLVDADLANNSASWQWVAGCGVDAAPYFRIFNPITQSEKFDPSGEYIRRWVPELRELDSKMIHTPWKIPSLNYPEPIVNHDEARIAALQAYKNLSLKLK